MQPAPDLLPSADHLSAENLKATARWLVAAGASVATILLAGTQVSDLARLKDDGTLLALLGALVAIASAGVLVFMAARVLEVRRPSMASLRRRARQDGASGQDPFEDPSSEFGRYVVERRNELLGPGRDTLEALERDRNAVFNALFRGHEVDVLGQALDPQNDAHATRLAILEADIEVRISRLQDAAELFETSRRYSMLLRWLWVCSLPFICGVGIFIYLTATAPESTPVRSPTPMTLRAPESPGDLEALGLSPSCAGLTLEAVAVGGTLAEPVVVTKRQGSCEPTLIEDTDGLLATPSLPD